jgi:lysozyme family protein
MQQNFEKALACTLREEGGFTSDPRDSGGPTNLGVTQRVWETFIGHRVDEAAMRALTLDDVRPLYRAFYWNKIAGDALPSGLDLALFDFAVNSGPYRASLTLQSLLSVKRDGIIGPNTLIAMGVEMKNTIFIPSPPAGEGVIQSMTDEGEPQFVKTRAALSRSASPEASEARGSGAPNISVLIAKLTIARLDYLRTLPAFSTFGEGWTARVNRVADIAAGMV